MTNDKKSIVIASCILGALVLILLWFSVFGLNLGIFKIASIQDIASQKQNVEKANTDLKTQETAYKTALKKIETAESSYNKEKNKYESISDETINIIKEATKEENYSMEYMWIKLGNYAKSNNLSLIVNDSSSSSKAGDAGTGTSGTVAGQGSTTGATTDTASTTNTANTTANTTAGSSNSATEADTKEGGTVLKIQVKGSYIDVSDFIFEVENDKELRFKLDNISIEYVEGTTIKANFDVKNLVIIK